MHKGQGCRFVHEFFPLKNNLVNTYKADKIQKKNFQPRPRGDPFPGTERKEALFDRREFAAFHGL